METCARLVYRLSKMINVIAGVFLSFMVLLTVCDVILRYFRLPIIGTYELVAFSGVVVIGFSLPLTQWKKGHIAVDFLISKLPLNVRKWIVICTRILSIVFFFSSGVYLFVMGKNLYANQEISATLRLPFYPLAFCLGVCLLVHCMVLLCEIVRIAGETNE